MPDRIKIRTTFVAGFLLCLAARPSLAQSSGPTFTSIADVGFGTIDEDGFVSVLLEQQVWWNDFKIAIAGPLRFRVIDREPEDSGTLREQDWDETSDYARILRSLSFVHEWDDARVDLRIGELNGVGIGHGAVVDAYFNSTDMDHYQGGLVITGDWAGNGIEFMLENILAPQIMVGRAFFAPLAWLFDGAWARRLEIGYTLGADIAAPHRVLAKGDTAIPVTGGDISLRLIDENRFVLMPYSDLMLMDGEIGVHAGVATSWTISKQKGLLLHLRGEYRYVGSDYHPAVFNPFYEYNRLYYDAQKDGGVALTLADQLAGEDLPAAHGFMADGVFEWEDKARISARYDTEGADRAHWLMFRLDLFPWKNHMLGIFYAAQDLQGSTGVFSHDALIGISARHRIIGPLDFFAEFTRRWRRLAQEMDFANEIVVGLGISLVF